MTSGAARQQSSPSRYACLRLWGGYIFPARFPNSVPAHMQHMEALFTIGNFDMTSRSLQSIKNGVAVIDSDWQRRFKRLLRRMTAGPLDPILLTFCRGPNFISIWGRAVGDLHLGQYPFDFFFPALTCVKVRYPSRGIRPLLPLKNSCKSGARGVPNRPHVTGGSRGLDKNDKSMKL